MYDLKIKIPHINKTVVYPGTDMYQVIGANGSGKTLFLRELMKTLRAEELSVIYNTSADYPILSERFLNRCSEKDITYAIQQLGSLSIDFRESYDRWKEHGISDLEFIEKEGNGTSQILKILLKLNSEPDVNFCLLDMPEASVHLTLLRALIRAYTQWFPQTKFVVATHSPEVFNRDYECVSLDDIPYGGSNE